MNDREKRIWDAVYASTYARLAFDDRKTLEVGEERGPGRARRDWQDGHSDAATAVANQASVPARWGEMVDGT